MMHFARYRSLCCAIKGLAYPNKFGTNTDLTQNTKTSLEKLDLEKIRNYIVKYI